jgi:pimeloyl-ACP methyl ester carboxylesterase
MAMAARIDRQFVSLESPTAMRSGAGYMPCQGLYVRPASKRPRCVLIAAHYNVDFSEHYLGEYFAQRGYGFLGWNTRYRGNEAFFLLEHALIDIGVGVRWLREQQDVEQLVILGNSGGGSLMAAYQSQAIDPSITPGRGLPLPPEVRGLPACDYYISLIAHPGRPEVLTAWMDPSVVDESDPTSIDPSLNMYDPANGPPYSPEFVARYRRAQQARNHRITDWVVAELERLRGYGMNDRAFNMYRTWADLRLMDETLEPTKRVPRTCYAGDPKTANFSPRGIGLTNTLRSWLSMWSLRESQCRGAPHLARITVPSLVIQSMADTGVYPSDAEAIYQALASKDKELQFMEGDHYLLTPDGARAEAADRIVTWLEARGVSG